MESERKVAWSTGDGYYWKPQSNGHWIERTEMCMNCMGGSRNPRYTGRNGECTGCNGSGDYVISTEEYIELEGVDDGI